MCTTRPSELQWDLQSQLRLLTWSCRTWRRGHWQPQTPPEVLEALRECYLHSTLGLKRAGVLDPVSSSWLRWNQKRSCYFWTSYSSGTQMAPSQQLYTGKPLTLTATWTSCLTICWPTHLVWSRQCTAGQEPSAQTSLSRARRPGTSDRLSSAIATQEKCFNTWDTCLP